MAMWWGILCAALIYVTASDGHDVLFLVGHQVLDLGVNPASMGDLIRVPMPPMSEERRKEMTKIVRQEGEQAKVAIRNLRRDANEHIKKLVKDKHVSEDEQKRAEGEIQKVTDKHIADIDSLVHSKEQEIMAV